MKRIFIWSLVAVNALLAAAVVARLLPENTALAQNRRSGDYMMIPGNLPGEAASVVFVIDSANGLLGGMAYDDSAKHLQTMPSIDLNRVFDAALRDQQDRGDRPRRTKG